MCSFSAAAENTSPLLAFGLRMSAGRRWLKQCRLFERRHRDVELTGRGRRALCQDADHRQQRSPGGWRSVAIAVDNVCQARGRTRPNDRCFYRHFDDVRLVFQEVFNGGLGCAFSGWARGTLIGAAHDSNVVVLPRYGDARYVVTSHHPLATGGRSARCATDGFEVYRANATPNVLLVLDNKKAQWCLTGNHQQL